MTIRVAIADDQPLVRAGFRALVDYDSSVEFAGEAADGEAAVRLALEDHPDVFLMDIRMPLLNGIDATRQIVDSPDTASTRVLILTTFDLDEYVYSALRAGASGFLLKDRPPEEVLEAIQVVAGGDALLSPRITRRLIEQFIERPARATLDASLDLLTTREREVLSHVAGGLSNSEIADTLFVSAATVKTHVARAMMKLDAHDRAQLVMLAYESGLVSPGWTGTTPEG